MSGEPEVPAAWRRRVESDLAASGCPEAEAEVLGYTIVAHGVMSRLQDRGDAESEAAAFLSVNAVVAEVRAVDSGEAVRARRKAADELTALTEELGLYDDGLQS